MKNRSLIFASIILTFVFTLVSCKTDDDGDRPEFELEEADQISAEDYSIYSLIIETEYAENKIVIAQKSSHNTAALYATNYIQLYRDFDKTLLNIYLDVNRNSKFFGPEFQSTTKEIILISDEELSYIFDQTEYLNVPLDWTEYYDEYENSNGYIKFSRIAFNKDRTQALLDFDSYIGAYNYEGKLAYLKKINGNWIIIEIKLLIIS